MKSLLTQTLVEHLRKQGVRAEVWDTRLPNFYIQVRATGAAAYYVRYTPLTEGADRDQMSPGKRQSFRVGDAAVLSVSQARVLAQSLLARVALGQDPMEDKRQARQCPTLAEVVSEHYLPHIRQTKKSWETDDAMLRCHILPALGHKALTAIGARDIEALMQAMRDGRSARPQGMTDAAKRAVAPASGYAPATCNRVCIVLRYLYNLAIEKWKLPGVKRNPATEVTLFEVHNIRQVFLSPAQIARLVEAGQPKPGQQNLLTLPITMFLVLTGVRKANALKARWCEIDEERALWNIPITKSGKPQHLQLSQEVLRLLQALPSRGQSEYLFPNPKTGKPFVSVFYSWNSLRRAAGLPHVRMHDLRHTFASLLVNAGASLFVVQKALGHSSPIMTQRYAHLADHTQRQAIQSAASQVSAVLPQMHALCGAAGPAAAISA
jgi:integrase